MGRTEDFIAQRGRNKAEKKKLGLVNIRIIQYKSDLKKDGTAPLYLQIRQGRNQTRIPLEVSVEPEYFDSARQKISAKHQRSKEVNLLIDNVLSKCTKIQTDYYLKGISLDPLKLREELTDEVSRHSFVEFWIHNSERQLERGLIQKSTFKSERESLERILRLQKDVAFNEITPAWLEELEGFLRSVMHLKESTIHKTIKHLRKYVKRAISEGTRMEDPFKHYSLPSVNATKIIWLTMEELHRIEEFYHSDFIAESLKRVLCPFLFACYTGIRHSDYHQVKADNLHGTILQFVPHKTRRFQRFVRIPLSEKATSFLNDEQTLGTVQHQQTINRHLKEVAKVCGIRKTLSTHVARHTFASNWIIAGRNVVALQKILGHAKLENTMVYVHLHSRDLQAEMAAFQEWTGQSSRPA